MMGTLNMELVTERRTSMIQISKTFNVTGSLKWYDSTVVVMSVIKDNGGGDIISNLMNKAFVKT